MGINEPEPGQERPEEHTGNSPLPLKWPGIISYNLNEEERPGGMKVRFKVRVVTGRKAAALDARQAEAIRELLSWVQQHRTTSHGEPPDGAPARPGR